MRAARRFWMVGTSSPFIYLVICVVIDRLVFLKRASTGFWPLPEAAFGWIFLLLGILATLTMPLLYLLKYRWALRGTRSRDDEDGSILDTICGRRFFILFMLCDFVALLGLILFLLQGAMFGMLFFGIVSLLDYAIVYPGESRPQ